ncbi:unnamed protein product [Larinioides sclopetarius]|uniref:Ubiquitin-like domain-containing protein n=1 Tax=Larinioides sclopetarius TaxID=280406 RepID=A0AAV2BA26_9ARAC
MHIFLRSQNLYPVDVEDGTVSDLKDILEAKEGISAEEQILYHGGNQLQDDEDITDCLVDGATVDVTVRLLGGNAKFMVP